MLERLPQTPQAPETEVLLLAAWYSSEATRQSAGASSGHALLEAALPHRQQGLLLGLPQGWRAARGQAALQRRAWSCWACPLCPMPWPGSSSAWARWAAGATCGLS